MFYIDKYDNFIIESYGEDKLVKKLTNYLIDLINKNFGKLILNRELEIKNVMSGIKDLIFVNDIIKIKISIRDYANILINNIIINNNCDIENMTMNIEVFLTPQDFALKSFNYNKKLFNTISHEFMHVIEKYYSAFSKKGLSTSFKLGERLQKIKKLSNSQIWEDICYFSYLSLPHEMRARVMGINAEIDNLKIKGLKKAEQYIINNKIYQDADFLSKINPKIMLDKLKNDKDYNLLIFAFNNTFLEKNYTHIRDCENNFLKFFETLKNKNKLLKNKILKTSFNFESYLEDYFDKEINYNEYLPKEKDQD
jgi:hypothetical protein